MRTNRSFTLSLIFLILVIFSTNALVIPLNRNAVEDVARRRVTHEQDGNPASRSLPGYDYTPLLARGDHPNNPEAASSESAPLPPPAAARMPQQSAQGENPAKKKRKKKPASDSSSTPAGQVATPGPAMAVPQSQSQPQSGTTTNPEAPPNLKLNETPSGSGGKRKRTSEGGSKPSKRQKKDPNFPPPLVESVSTQSPKQSTSVIPLPKIPGFNPTSNNKPLVNVNDDRTVKPASGPPQFQSTDAPPNGRKRKNVPAAAPAAPAVASEDPPTPKPKRQKTNLKDVNPLPSVDSTSGSNSNSGSGSGPPWRSTSKIPLPEPFRSSTPLQAAGQTRVDHPGSGPPWRSTSKIPLPEPFRSSTPLQAAGQTRVDHDHDHPGPASASASSGGQQHPHPQPQPETTTTTTTRQQKQDPKPISVGQRRSSRIANSTKLQNENVPTHINAAKEEGHAEDKKVPVVGEVKGPNPLKREGEDNTGTGTRGEAYYESIYSVPSSPEVVPGGRTSTGTAGSGGSGTLPAHTHDASKHNHAPGPGPAAGSGGGGEQRQSRQKGQKKGPSKVDIPNSAGEGGQGQGQSQSQGQTTTTVPVGPEHWNELAYAHLKPIPVTDERREPLSRSSTLPLTSTSTGSTGTVAHDASASARNHDHDHALVSTIASVQQPPQPQIETSTSEEVKKPPVAGGQSQRRQRKRKEPPKVDTSNVVGDRTTEVGVGHDGHGHVPSEGGKANPSNHQHQQQSESTPHAVAPPSLVDAGSESLSSNTQIHYDHPSESTVTTTTKTKTHPPSPNAANDNPSSHPGTNINHPSTNSPPASTEEVNPPTHQQQPEHESTHAVAPSSLGDAADSKRKLPLPSSYKWFPHPLTTTATTTHQSSPNPNPAHAHDYKEEHEFVNYPSTKPPPPFDPNDPHFLAEIARDKPPRKKRTGKQTKPPSEGGQSQTTVVGQGTSEANQQLTAPALLPSPDIKPSKEGVEVQDANLLPRPQNLSPDSGSRLSPSTLTNSPPQQEPGGVSDKRAHHKDLPRLNTQVQDHAVTSGTAVVENTSAGGHHPPAVVRPLQSNDNPPHQYTHAGNTVNNYIPPNTNPTSRFRPITPPLGDSNAFVGTGLHDMPTTPISMSPTLTLNEGQKYNDVSPLITPSRVMKTPVSLSPLFGISSLGNEHGEHGEHEHE